MSTGLVTATVQRALREAIAEGRLAPAERINQEEIARTFGVSRTPVREALYSLAREGLVDLVPWRGAFVSSFTEQDVFELYDVRELLEPQAAARACLLATSVEVAAIRRVAAVIEAETNLERAFALNRELHERLCAPCGNRLLLTLLGTVWSQHAALRIFTYYASASGSAERMRTEHREIVEAFAARDAERTRDLVRAHIAKAHRALAELIADYDTKESDPDGSPGAAGGSAEE
jgi:DNA-binding GntR family transcriptional regulator